MGAGSSILSLCQTTKVVLYDDQGACYNPNERCEQLPQPGSSNTRRDVVIHLTDNSSRTVQLVAPTSSIPNKVINPVFVSTISLSHLHRRKMCPPFVLRGPSRTYPQLVRKQPTRSHRRTSKDYIDLLYQEYPLTPVPASGRTVRLLPKVCLDRLPMAVHPLYTCNPLQEGHVIARAVYRG